MEGSESAAQVTIITPGYRAKCAEPACWHFGRVILRYVDTAGRPMNNTEFCNPHARIRIERDRAAGLRIYDDRGTVQSTPQPISSNTFPKFDRSGETPVD
jgi:hypothetical protein